MRYLQQIGWGRKLQAEKIKARQKELNENIIALEEQKTAKNIVGIQRNRKQSACNRKERQRQNLSSFTGKRSCTQGRP